jgi:alpha-beta hydrolase superfamily lysophospholipase
MDHVEGTFTSVRDAEVYYQGWLPEGDARAVVLVVHGIGEHCGRYEHVVERLVPLGYAVYGLDHIGHGKSEGQREFVERFEEYTETLTIYYDMIQGWQAGKPVFLLGHSMGGLIAAYYLLDHQERFRGGILSGPAVKVGEDVSRVTILMGRLLSALAPKAGLMALDAEGMSRDPEVVAAYVNDPLVFTGKMPARTAAEVLDAMLRVTAEAGKITLPLLILQGGADKIIDPAGAEMLYEKASSPDKTLRVYEGLYHEVFNEPECDRVLQDVENWLEGHV